MTTAKKTKVRSRRLLFFSLAALLLLVLGLGGFILEKALHLENYKTEILEVLQSTLHRQVLYESGTFSFRLTPAFTFKKIVIMEKDGSAPLLTADKLTFRIALLPLLDKRLVLRGIELEKPSVVLTRDLSGVFNVSDLFEGSGKEVPLQIRGIRVKDGKLSFSDRGAGPGEVVTILDRLDLSIHRFVRGTTTDFKLSASVLQGRDPGELQLSGKLTPAATGKPLLETTFEGSVEAKNLVADHFWEYYARYVPFRKVLGRLEMDTTFKGKLTEFSSEGSMKISRLRFDYPQIFHAVLTPKNLSFKYAMELTPQDIKVTSLNLNVDVLNVKGSCLLKDIPSGDIFIEARAKTSFFRLEDFAGYIPYGVIADDASRYIEEHIKGGTYQLEQGSLIGRVSQIVHMEKGTNYNVLAIRGTVDKGLVGYGPNVPTFNGIKGHLAMQGKDFILSGMQGNFGGSPFTLEGKITNYPLMVPCDYPFSMTMKPRPAEVFWLLGQDKKKISGLSGDSTLSLTGSGPIAGYALSGNWDLSPATYFYRDLVAKKAGQTNHLFFQSLLSDKGVKISSFRIDMMPLMVSGSAEYQSGKERPLSFTVRSNNFPIQGISSSFPRLAKYQPAGKVHVTLHGTGGGAGEEGPLLGGEITLAGASFKPAESTKALTNINGTVGFNGESLKTSNLTANLGSSTITGSGALTGFAKPIVMLDFSSPSVDLADLGLHSSGQKKLAVEQVKGSLSFQDDTLSIKSLSGRINRSVIRASGTVGDLRNPKVELKLDADYLDMEDVGLLAGLERDTPVKSGAGRSSFHATVNAEAGRFHQVEFKKLHSDVHLEQKILYVEGAKCTVLGGQFAASGRVDFGTTGGPRYQTTLQLKNISAAQFLQLFGTKKELTGTMSIEGDLIAKGDTLDEVKATSLGNLRLHCEKGTLRKFSLLSKLFSILNVSQLFTFKLPDMVSNGMPYNEINASFSLRDGLVTTDDLFIDSNAMNITIVGEFDLVKEQIKATVGVKPLQTIDKVVSHIPFVGWVLTGKNKSLITTYFQATGSLDNPEVKSIAAQSMAKGVFNIFKRLFSLPAKLVTNTGEVIINQ
ncbi:MAG: AsmA-like C-terminal domain-containing protein [Geobacteraceae bacterium]|nr:AsmA-like C-terminal domain-containing protein [Geobacteraceae bacterium]